MTKQEVIENLYLTFNKYTTSDMHHCDCGCIDSDDVRKLSSKKLRELEEDDFSSYHGSALHTWGEVEHYKHFLPRILEVHNILKGKGSIGLYEITTKLDYAKWASWNGNEIEAIKNFILIDWIEFVNDKVSEIDKNDLKHYSYFFGLQELLALWNLSEGTKGLRNFIDFFYNYGTEMLNGGLRIQDKLYESEWKDLINSKNILKSLEMEFFGYAESDSNYSEKISVVIQMIEQERKVGKSL